MASESGYGQSSAGAVAEHRGEKMFMVEQADLISIRRAFMAGGRARALIELRRRYMALTDKTAPTILDRILAMPVEQVKFAGRHEPKRDAPKG